MQDVRHLRSTRRDTRLTAGLCGLGAALSILLLVTIV
jgi:hypothetical protein